MSVFWTEKRTDLEGSRWQVWEKYYRSIIDWETFKTKVLEFNPSVDIDSRWLFIKGWSYIMPSSSQIEAKTISESEIDLDNETVRNMFAQEILKRDGYYKGDIDGVIGSESLYAITHYPNIDKNWIDSRKIIALIQFTAIDNGLNPGPVDGYWGHQTEYATEQLLRLLSQGEKEEIWRPEQINMVNPNNWPVQYSKEFDDFYGKSGESNLTNLSLPYKHKLSWDIDREVSRIKCHKKVKESFNRILTKVLDHYGLEEIRRLRLDVWGGCYSDRTIRGGTKPSMHSWGIAMDYDPVNNKLKWGRDRALLAKPEYEPWWKIWEDEGWLSLGRQKNFDWMHVQAAKL